MRDPVLFPGSVHPLLPMTRRVPWSEPVPAIQSKGVKFTTVFNYRVRESFAYDGRVVAKGEVLDGNGSLVRGVLASRPDLLEVTREKA